MKRRSLFLLLPGLLGLMACGPAVLSETGTASPSSHDGCAATFRDLGGRMVDRAGRQVMIGGLIIGCREQLEAITPTEIDALREALIGAVSASHSGLSDFIEGASERQRLATRLNVVLATSAISDVFAFATPIVAESSRGG